MDGNGNGERYTHHLVASSRLKVESSLDLGLTLVEPLRIDSGRRDGNFRALVAELENAYAGPRSKSRIAVAKRSQQFVGS